MKVMTFNLQSWNYSDERENSVKEVIERYLPEVIGFQEVTPRWEEFLKKNSKFTEVVQKFRDGFDERLKAFLKRRSRLSSNVMNLILVL